MATGMMAAGSLISAYGSYQSGQAQSASLTAQASINLQNAQEAEAQGGLNAYAAEINASQAIGHQAAEMGAFGGNNASTYGALASSASDAELNRLNILHQADVNSIQYQNEAALEKAGASSASIGGFLGAFGSIFSGIGQAYTAGYGTGSTNTQSTTQSTTPTISSTTPSPNYLGTQNTFASPYAMTSSSSLLNQPSAGP